MRKYLAILSPFALLLMFGCAHTSRSTLSEVYPKMYTSSPVTILIMPPVNNTTAADAKEYFSCSLSEALGLKGYYPMPVETVFSILRDEGLYETENANAVVLANLGKYFGADAVLFSTIERWDKSWFLTSGTLTIDAGFSLVSTATAETLWDFSTTAKVELSSDSDSFLLAMLESAVKTAVEDYFPHARSANILTMKNGLPYGKHHPQYGLDGTEYVNPHKHGVYDISK